MNILQLVSLFLSTTLLSMYCLLSEVIAVPTPINIDNKNVLIEPLKVGTAQEKQIYVKPIKLKDNAGLEYIGGIVSQADIQVYLAQMKAEVGESFSQLRSNQAARDHNAFHLTLINPFELQTLDIKSVDLTQSISVTLHGLGRVSQAEKSTYFVVASSPSGQHLRQALLLKPKDFHVTLGFEPNDIYGVRKGLDTLIVK